MERPRAQNVARMQQKRMHNICNIYQDCSSSVMNLGSSASAGSPWALKLWTSYTFRLFCGKLVVYLVFTRRSFAFARARLANCRACIHAPANIHFLQS